METVLFTHTYEIAIKLGVQYVWIDSLCIVQDDANDWAKESAKMADYYQHAWLTVAATRTRNNGGLFGELNVKDLARVTRLPYRERDGSQKGYFYIQCPGGSTHSRVFYPPFLFSYTAPAYRGPSHLHSKYVRYLP